MLSEIESAILSPAYEAAAVPVSVVHHEGRHSSRKLRAFLDLAIAALREDGALR